MRLGGLLAAEDRLRLRREYRQDLCGYSYPTSSSLSDHFPVGMQVIEAD
jgi:hypothetical protein